LVLITLIAALFAGPSKAQDAPSDFDPAGWVEDLEQVRQAMASHYANLDWAVSEREAPLGPLFAVGRERLLDARSEAEAREVFERLERYLGDGHVEFVWPRPGQATAAAAGPAADERPPCE